MGVDPWADENDEHETRGGVSSGEGVDELEREARRRREQFYNEGYREGVEEGKKATVQEGFNLGFREGATAGLAYGQARGAACSVAIFAGQVPGSSGWKASVAATTRMLEETKPSAAAKSAREDFERVLAAEAAGSDPGTPDASHPSADEGSFGERMRNARRELESAGFQFRDFNLAGADANEPGSAT